jgi:flagellar basal-body rod modification protein FlgD
MEIQSPFSPVDPEAAASTSSLDAGSQVLGEDQFLQLLVTQLSNQDPLNPLDGQEFAAQLAQFSTVEQLVNIKETLEGNNASIDLLSQSTNAGIAAGLIGRTIEAEGNAVDWSGESDVPLAFDLGAAAASVTLTIRDEAGNVVRTLDVGAMGKGDQTVDWDGTNADGATVEQGVYTFEVAATDADGNTVTATTLMRGAVDRVTFGLDGILLWLGDVSVPLEMVSSVES